MTLLCLILFFSEPVELKDTIRELVYRAEVYEEWEKSADQLNQFLGQELEPSVRRRVVRALAVVKHGLPGPGLALSDNGLTPLTKPLAVIAHQKQAWLLVERTWLGLGDWVGDWFVLEIGDTLLLERIDGRQRETSLPQAAAPNQALLFNASTRDVLTFVSRRVELNSFVPSDLDLHVSGTFPIKDWHTFLDRVCRDAEVAWTRRGDNIIFTPPQSGNRLDAGRLELVNSEGASLSAFLQNLAETFDMELILEDGLGHVQVDIHVEDQTWDEVLDCLSIMNGFNWFLVRDPGTRARLFIQKE